MLPDFSHKRPTTVEEAAEHVSFDAAPYFGGTELLAAMKMGLLQPQELIDLKPIDALRGVHVDGNDLVIGAGTTHYVIANNPLVQEHAPILAEMEQHVGNVRVRMTGSIGGNICFAEPKSDVTTTLLALDATLTLVSTEGSRNVTMDEFLLGPYFTSREENEILTEIRIPILPKRRGVYLKYQTMERPTLGVALVANDDGSRTLTVGAVGGRPERFEYARGDTIDPEQVAMSVEVIADLTGSERYKRHIVQVFVQRAVEEVEAQV